MLVCEGTGVCATPHGRRCCRPHARPPAPSQWPSPRAPLALRSESLDSESEGADCHWATAAATSYHRSYLKQKLGSGDDAPPGLQGHLVGT